jgi:peptidyl-tRNA hydrolase
MGILYSSRQDHGQSNKYLIEAENLYKEFKKLGLPPLTISDMFGTEIEPGKGKSL